MISVSSLLLLALLFFAIAALYSSVGFGGGSSYLAILSLYLKDTLLMKTTGLLCNLVVVGSGSYLFASKKLIDWRRSVVILACGVPASFCGSLIGLRQGAFFITLGAVLLASGLLLCMQYFVQQEAEVVSRKTPFWIDIILGGGIGFLSGLVGIGGGILLSPVLNLLRWDSPGRIAALASLFILANSVAGLIGQLAGHNFRFDGLIIPTLLIAVFLGGQLGTRAHLRIARPALIKALTGVLVSYIGLKLVLLYTAGIRI